MASRPSVFLAGTFDVANYGDLLFPLIASARLSAAGIDVIPVSPTATRPAFADAMAPVAADRMLEDRTLDPHGVLVGGGYIVMTQRATGLPRYETAGVADEAYPALWIGAALAAAVRDIPLVWNAPGAPLPFSSRRRNELIVPALHACDYPSVRDAQSARMFGSVDVDWSVVPDTALDLARIWSHAELADLHRARLVDRGLPPDTRTLAIHVRSRALGDARELAAQIDGLAAQHGLFPLLVVLGAELGDGPVARRISAEMSVAHQVVDDAPSLCDLAAVIAGSAVYIGGSFHGYVTAAAYGTPAVMVAIPAHGKFSGLLAQLDRPRDLSRNWEDAFARAQEHLAAGTASVLPATVPEALDRHWATIIEALRHPERGRARRMAFLRSYLRHGAGRLGSPWLVTPHLAGLNQG